MIKIDFAIVDFLRESNNIEGVFGDDSLAQALFAWGYIMTQKKLTPSVIRKTHKILMLHHLVGPQKGYFRTEPVWIGNREGIAWKNIPHEVSAWCDRWNDRMQEGARNKAYDEGFTQEMHIRYEKIHPFIDGNGRTGRIFLNWQRVQCKLPILVIKNEEKLAYYSWFQ